MVLLTVVPKPEQTFNHKPILFAVEQLYSVTNIDKADATLTNTPPRHFLRVKNMFQLARRNAHAVVTNLYDNGIVDAFGGNVNTAVTSHVFNTVINGIFYNGL